MELVSLKDEFRSLSRENKFLKYRELWKKSAKFEVLTDYPLHLDIELSGKCNLKCEACFQNGLLKGDLGVMDSNLFMHIIDEGVENGLCAIKLQVRGEALMHPAFFELANYAKEKGIMDVQVTTNGTLLNQKNIEKLLESGIDGIIFSVDPHHETSFSKKYSNTKYSSIEEMINKLLEARQQKQLRKPWVRLRASIEETDRYLAEKIKYSMKQRFPNANIYIVGRIFNFLNDEDAFSDLHINYSLDKCSYLTQRLAVFFNGFVTVCCVDYNAEFGLGSLQEKSIKDIWLSEKIKQMRKMHIDGKRKYMNICKHCASCISPLNDNIYHDTTARHIADQEKTT